MTTQQGQHQQHPLRMLFGGAITMEIPDRFVDVSQFRGVPDNQEVFADANTDQSFIIELLEMPSEEEAPDDSACTFHFNSIAHDGDATNTVLESDPQCADITDDIQRSVTWGLQQVSKYREGARKANNVRVFVGCFRLKGVATDCVVSFNSPTFINPNSAVSKDVSQKEMEHHNTDDSSYSDFMSALDTFQIHDWSLFGHCRK